MKIEYFNAFLTVKCFVPNLLSCTENSFNFSIINTTEMFFFLGGGSRKIHGNTMEVLCIDSYAGVDSLYIMKVEIATRKKSYFCFYKVKGKSSKLAITDENSDP